MLEHFLGSFLLLFLILDPVGMIPIFIQVTESLSFRERRTVAYLASLYSCILMLFFGLFGESLFRLLGISTQAVKIAGGMLLFKISLDMIFSVREKRRRKVVEEGPRHDLVNQLAISPLTIPLIAGPGAVTAIIVLRAEHEALISTISILDFTALLLVLALLFLGLIVGNHLHKILGDHIFNLLSRLFGMMLAFLAVQIFIDALPTFWFAS